MTRYSKQVPTLVSNTVSNADELSRWILDWHGIAYIDERHAPGLHVGPSNKAAGIDDGIANNPVFVTTDAVVSQKDGVLKYTEPRCAPERRLLPEDPQRNSLAEELFAYFWHELWRPVGRYVYALILPHRSCTAPMMRRGVPLWERIIVTLFYGLLAKQIAKGLELDKFPPQGELAKIKRVFARVEALLSDGRRYLTGDTVTVADLMFATNAAPVLLPPEFRGSAASLESLPDELRRQVLLFQDSPAGQFALRIFREHRPPLCNQQDLPKEPGLLARMISRVTGALFGRKFWARLFAIGGKVPMLRFGHRVLVNKYELVTDVLERDEDFTIKEINLGKMAKLSVTFFLGMDRSSQHQREFSLTMKMVEKGDLEAIRGIVRKTANAQMELARERGRIDVVTSLGEIVMVRVLREYFGVGGPNEATMVRWLRALFWDLFLNHSDSRDIHQRALQAATELKQHLTGEIESRRRTLLENPKALPDNLLNRMIRAQQEPGNAWLDNDTVRRNISGLIIGALSTNARAIVLVLDELLDRPRALREAVAAARRDDIDTVLHYAFEALRFNPHNPAVIRFAEEAQSVRSGDGKTRTIRAKSKVFAAISPAMFDPERFPSPKRFDPTRDLKLYLHFGHGFHKCFGRHINAIVIPEVCAVVLRRTNLRRGPGRAGRGMYEGPFPTNFVVTFD